MVFEYVLRADAWSKNKIFFDTIEEVTRCRKYTGKGIHEELI